MLHQLRVPKIHDQRPQQKFNMKLSAIHIHNFKCYDDLKIVHLHPKMNILIGNNATGKSSLLEAIRVLIGSLYLKFDKYENKIAIPGITDDDVRLETINKSLEQILPCYVYAEAEVDSLNKDGKDSINWKRSVETKGGKTLYKEAKEMLTHSKSIQQSVRDGLPYNLPLIAFFSTDRYKKERKSTDVKSSGSRMQGYFNALDTTTNIKFFIDLFYTETLDQTQNGTESELLKTVYSSVQECLNCQSLKYLLKKQELMVGYEEEPPLPFSMLSDGVRSTLAMVMELAFRCYLLNPHLGVDAPKRTKGVVLIDEIDLHLHPSWQTHILEDLRKAFPELQFIVTTHAPLVISQIDDCCIYSISDRQIFNFPNQNGRTLDYIIEQMGVDYAKKGTKEKLATYFGLIETGKGKQEEAISLRNELETLLGKNHAELKRADMLLTFF